MQREALLPAMNAGWRIQWGSDLAEAAWGTRPCVMVGNEFWDALPVHLVDVRGPRPLEAWVEVIGGARREGGKEFREVWGEVSEHVEVELRSLFGTFDPEVLGPLSIDGLIELRPVFRTQFEGIGAVMPVGSLLTIDYGGWKRKPNDWNDAGRPSCVLDPAGGDFHRRTLRGYFRHQLVDDPYARVGSQDLTADVDFRALDLHGREKGFETVLFTTVAALLQGDAGEDRLSELLQCANLPTSDALQADREARVLEALLDSEGLGGAFKVMLQVRE
jgi:SAM-dependent MidA family methyltransferase